jgi:hypothetical protein
MTRMRKQFADFVNDRRRPGQLVDRGPLRAR